MRTASNPFSPEFFARGRFAKRYDIPYVNRFHPFSEMPLLGYAGYLPYGFLAWVCWLVAAHILDLRPNFDLTMEPDQEPEIAATSR